MTVSIIVLGAEKLTALGMRLKAAGDEGLQKELRKGLLKATRPLITAVRRAEPEYMPKGYEPVLLKAMRFKTKIGSRGGASVTIQLRAPGRTRGRAIKAMNDLGVLRHPVFGHHHRWVDQPIRPEFFNEPMERDEDKVRDNLIDAMDAVARKIAG